MLQSDVLRLFDEFAVASTDDFLKLAPGKKPYFISRLYKAFEKNRQEAFRDLAIIGGVNFHFATSGDLEINSPNIPTESFLKKLCFYSNRTLITFPFREVSKPEETQLLKGLHPKEWTKSKLRKSRPIVFGNISSSRGPIGGFLVSRGKSYTLDVRSRMITFPLGDLPSSWQDWS